jgi:hypothetical protein
LHAYNHQGFEVFLEKDSSMRFACKNQCAVEIMAPIQGDGINLSTKNAK